MYAKAVLTTYHESWLINHNKTSVYHLTFSKITSLHTRKYTAWRGMPCLLSVYFWLSNSSTGQHSTTDLQWIYLSNTFVSVGKISTKQIFQYITYDILHNNKIYFKFFIFIKLFTTWYINTTHTFPTLNCISPTVLFFFLISPL